MEANHETCRMLLQAVLSQDEVLTHLITVVVKYNLERVHCGDATLTGRRGVDFLQGNQAALFGCSGIG